MSRTWPEMFQRQVRVVVARPILQPPRFQRQVPVPCHANKTRKGKYSNNIFFNYKNEETK
jgi:hypothetical protein